MTEAIWYAASVITSNPTPYDETPYPSGPYRQAHPDRLETLARFFGMTPPDIRNCRVLELGAADGSNLIPMACALPQSRFVGIDLSQRHVQAGEETIAALGLANMELLHLDILGVDERFGKFDYVIVHGVYSWVPREVQERILEICSALLSENGVAYVSYNTNPGWRMRGQLRDMMLYHTRRFDDPKQRVDQARTLVEWLAETVEAENNPYGMLLKRELDQMRNWHDAYFRHDSLAEINEPVYFHEFVERAERHGLQYLAEAEFTPMLASNYAPSVDAALNAMGRDIIEVEQYMDFLRNRLFRQTLLCHRGVKLNRALGPWSLEGFHVGASLRLTDPETDFASDAVATFRGARDLTISTGQPIVKAALACLADAWPQSLAYSQLLTKARSMLVDRDASVADAATDARVLGGALLTCYTKGLAELHAHEGPFVTVPGDCPCACPLARLQASRGDAVTNRRHERLYLDDFGQHLLRRLDGKHDRNSLLVALTALVADGTLVAPDAEQPGDVSDDAHAALAARIDARLTLFGRQAVLVPSSTVNCANIAAPALPDTTVR
jgi:methyltransferase-like protein/predicted nicotinamide N-methyase